MSEWHFSADTGGTFTDCLAEGPDGSIRRGKVLSSGRLRTSIRAIHPDGSIGIETLPLNDVAWLRAKPAWIHGVPAGIIYEASPDRIVIDNVPEGIKGGDILEIDSGLEAPVLAMKLLVPEAGDPGNAISFRLGTTKGTNALLEQKGAPVALFLTRGFEDLLLIRDQKRPDLFARQIKRPQPLYHRVYGIDGRMNTKGGEETPLDTGQLAEAGKQALTEGCTVAAICFLNSWCNAWHEEQAAEVLRMAGFSSVVVSSRVRPLIISS